MALVIDYSNGVFEAVPSGETVGTITGNATLDLTSGNLFNHTPTANTTFVFSNPPTTGSAYDMTLKVVGANVTSGYDIANASYDSVSFSVSGQEANPYDIFFKPDGTKMYVTGASGDDVNEYSLSTAWDITTGSYVQNFSVSAQETAPTGLFFKSDGTKMYVVGQQSDNVNEYNLSTAWDVSTASYVQNFSVNSQESVPRGLYFNPNGTKFFINGAIGDDINEYSLSTAWDVSTASFTTNFSVASQEGTPNGLSFNDDGTKMYIVGTDNDTVYEYDLSTGFDLSTASYNSVSFSVASQDVNPTGLFFKTDGSKMYVIGLGNKTIYQYSTTGSSALATIAWPSSVKWAGGTAPSAPASGEKDVYNFFTLDGGTTYYGFQAGDAMA